MGYKTTYGWAQQGKLARDHGFRKIEDIMKEINQIMDSENTGKPQQLLGKFYHSAKQKRLSRILNLPKDHPARHSTIDPSTGAEWFFRGKRHGGPKIRWEREIIKTTWNETRMTLKGEEAITATKDYITNTVGKVEHKMTANNAAIIEILETKSKREALEQQYRKAWFATRVEVKKVYDKEHEYYQIAKKEYDPTDMVMEALIEQLYPGIDEGTNRDWNEIWEELKELKRTGPPRKRIRNPPDPITPQTEYQYRNIRWNNHQRLWLEEWYTAEKKEINSIYGCEANPLVLNDIKKKIERFFGWEGEDDRTDELEEWKLYKELGPEERQVREAFVAIDRLRMTRHIAKTKLEIENKCKGRNG